MTKRLLLALVLAPLPLAAGSFDAQVVVLGELHDNPGHHARQAALLAEIVPTAVVYEMLSPAEAAALDALPREAEAMARGATGMDWGNLPDYAGVLAASPVILGAALPRDVVRGAFAEGAAAVFDGDAEAFGLTLPVPEDQLEIRMQLQFAAHCEAMPLEMMGGMVEAQRVRDAGFARTVLYALAEHGAPVVLITGNGHARRDWGVPFYIAQAAPEVSVFSLGQGEPDRAPQGVFDAVETSPAPDRGDPCAAFR